MTKSVRSVTPSINYAREDIQLKKMFKVAKEDKTYQLVVERLRSRAAKLPLFISGADERKF